MRSKEIILILLFGIIAGIGVSPFVNNRPQEVLISPVSTSFAQEKDIKLRGSAAEIILPENKNIETALTMSKKRVQENPVPGQVISEKSGRLTIAVLGDSMVDTMGSGLPYLEKVLKQNYPNYDFNLLNYGVGATDIDYGITRLTSSYNYLGKQIPSLISTKPDIVIVESFAYNPWGTNQSDLDRHWLSKAKIVDILKSQTGAKIMLLATIAPNKSQFGSGPKGVNWDQPAAYAHAEKIDKYLENTLQFADSQKIPVIDAYTPSNINGDGNLDLINRDDHIHPSQKGCEFIAKLTVDKLASLGFIN